MIDGAQQCSVLQVISGEILMALLLRGVWVLVLFVLRVIGCGIKCLRFSQRAVYNYYFMYSCLVLLDVNMRSMTLRRSRMPMLPDHARPECHVGRYRFTSHPTCDRGEFSTSPFENA